MRLACESDGMAILGGTPVRQRPWPAWPRVDENTERIVMDVLHSERWAVSGRYNGRKLYERQFAEAFAAYNGVPYCVPTSSGTAALTVALQALGVGHGDEVLVPGLTWVACASSVVTIGGIPILVDIDPDTLCMSADAVRAAISERTAAALLVHMCCAVADLDAFMELSRTNDIPIIEDCAQAHGATWRGQRVGTFGTIGAFSMQDSKVLTCGEGGATITADPCLYDRMQQLRADGRRYSAVPPLVGGQELEEVGSVQGRNMCLSELHAAILVDRLAHLDEENAIRERNGEYLRCLLAAIGGVVPLSRHPAVDSVTFSRFCVRLDLDAFAGIDIELIRSALAAELSVPVSLVNRPLNNNVLYNPLSSSSWSPSESLRELLDPRRFALPEAVRARQECLMLPHWVLLGNESDTEDLAFAFAKVKRSSDSLALLHNEN